MSKTYPYGALMLDVAGFTLTAEEREKIAHPNTGAVILFSRNYHDREQISQLIQEIRRARAGKILIAVDQEGGRVQRFRQGFTRLPPAAFFQQQPQLAEKIGWLMAVELLAVGVDFSFAPVLDINYGVSEVIGDRAFADSPTQIAQLAGDFRRGMRAAGMAATGKHFPGHGAVSVDSHLDLPVDLRDLATIRAQDLVPFQQLINEGLEAIMPAHIVYPAVDTQAAGFSSVWLQQILRQELNFQGVIFSDDLSMEGAASVGDFCQRATLAQQSGCDMVLVCNNSQASTQVLVHLPQTANLLREQRLATMQAQNAGDYAAILKSKDYQTISNSLKELTNVE